MADYGVPEELDGALPWSWAEERLLRNRNYWVVTASASGRPHAMPVWGVWLAETERFWFSCAPSSHKLRNITANPQVVVMVDDTVECVSVEGVARIADGGEAAPMIASYLAKYWDDPAQHPETEAFIRSNAIVEVAPTRAFGIIEREDEFARSATRWSW
jgi:PPOX class probable F420-dependent enzyme